MFGGGIGIQEVVVIGVVAVLLFGSRLPEVARTLGNTYQQFRKGLSDLQSTIKVDIDSPPDNRYGGLPDYSDSYVNQDETAPDFQPPVENEDDDENTGPKS